MLKELERRIEELHTLRRKYEEKARQATGPAREYYQGIFEGVDYSLHILMKDTSND